MSFFVRPLQIDRDRNINDGVVAGRVAGTESGQGLLNLLVTAIALPAGTRSDEIKLLKGQSIEKVEQLGGRRLGSAITDNDGRFSVRYESEWGRNLLLVVSTADGESAEGSGKILHTPAAPRRNFARDEEFLVCISENALAKGRAPIGPAVDPRETFLNRLRGNNLDWAGAAARNDSPVVDAYRVEHKKLGESERQEQHPKPRVQVSIAEGTAELQFDRDADSWSLHRPDGAVAVQFGGQRPASGFDRKLLKPGVNYVVDGDQFFVVRLATDLSDTEVPEPDVRGPDQLLMRFMLRNAGPVRAADPGER